MKQKLFSLLLALTASVGMLVNASVKIGDLYYNLDATTQTAELTHEDGYGSYSTYRKDTVVVPSSFSYENVPYTVTAIAAEAFYNNRFLRYIVIPDGVTSIGMRAFYGCIGLTEITLPNSVTSIGSSAFYDVLNITYKGSATGSPWGARCVNGYVDRFLVYEDSNRRTLWACSIKASGAISLPISTTIIKEGAFSDCTGLTEITIPGNVTAINGETFSHCRSLTKVSLPNSVTIIRNQAFYYCTSLASITLPNSVTSIGDHAFSGCTSLTSVTIPNSVTNIGGYAFSGCTSLTSVTIPNSVTNIGSSVFYECIGMRAFLVASDNPNYSSEDGVLFNKGKSSLILYPAAKQVANYTIPNSVTSIGGYAFSGCTSLTSVTIPNSVTNIGGYAFSGCTSLTSVTIPNSVTNIGSSVFYECIGLTEITLPNSVTSIGDHAFSGCTSLTSVTIPNSVTNIGSSVFYECIGLTEITLPNSVTSIGRQAFGACTGLTSVTIPNTVTRVGDFCFAGCDNLKSVKLSEQMSDIKAHTFVGCSRLQTAYIPSSVTTIFASAFAECTDLNDLMIPNTVTSIGSQAFKGVNSITYNGSAEGAPWGAKKMNGRHILPDGYTEGFLVYDDATKKRLIACSPAATGNIEIPSSVTSIRDSAFYGCTDVINVIIPTSVTDIGKSAFSPVLNIVYNGPETDTSWGARCKNGYVEDLIVYGDATKTNLVACSPTITGSVVIPNSVTYVSYEAFEGCKGIEEITIGENVQSIGSNAFHHCDNLRKVIWNTTAFRGSSESHWGGSYFSWWQQYNDSYSTNNTIYSCCPITSVVFGPNVVSIPSRLFERVTSLRTITLPGNIKSIDSYAFLNCTGLTSVIMEEGVTTIGDNSFDGCTRLTDISFPNSVTTIGNSAFNNCKSIKTITLSESVIDIQIGAFANCYSLQSVMCKALFPPKMGIYTFYGDSITGDVFGGLNKEFPIYVLSGSYSLYKKADQWKDLNLIPKRMPSNINGINYILNCEEQAAEVTYDNLQGINYSELSTATIPQRVSVANYDFDVTSIADSAFMNCPNLNSVTIPQTITVVPDYAFNGCGNLAMVSLPNTLTSIGNHAFANLSSRKFNSIIFPHSVSTIGKNAFANDIYLENIEFGDNMEYIQDSAFLNCSRVMEMTCWSEFTPNVETDAISSIKSSADLYVRSSCLRKYQMDDNWSRFLLKEIGANETTVANNEVTVVPEDNTALFTWPTNNAADTYTLTITKDGVVFCTLVFNANGQLTGIAFAPGRNGAPHGPAAELTSAGMQFTVTGLNIATIYGFDLAVKDNRAQVLASYSGQFGTTGAYEAIDNISANANAGARKEFRDGQVLILRGDKTYTLTGQEVK